MLAYLYSLFNTPSSSLPPLANQLPSFTSHDAIHHGRHLLSADDLDNEVFQMDFSNKQYNINDIEQTMNRIRKYMDNASSDDVPESGSRKAGGSPGAAAAVRDWMTLRDYSLQLTSMCPMYYNSTESERYQYYHSCRANVHVHVVRCCFCAYTSKYKYF